MSQFDHDKWPFKAVLFDMDGVLYHGDQVLPHACALLRSLGDTPVQFVTNNPIATPAGVADRLQQMGFQRPSDDQVLTSGLATAEYLHKEKPGFRYFAVGAAGLDALLARYGVADAEQADYVVVGEGPGLDYASLAQGIELVLKRGAELISTNPDQTVDGFEAGQHRILPGGGALVAPFEVACARKALSIGKPAPLLYQMALARLGVDAADAVMVGDRPDTDILGAQRCGIRTALVRTGRFGLDEPLPDGVAKPDWDVANLAELAAAWGMPRD